MKKSNQYQVRGGMLAGMLPLLCGTVLMQRFHEKPDDDGGSTAVLEGLQAAKKQMDDITTKVDQWMPETKKASEELTKLKNSFEGFDSQVANITKTMNQLRLQLARERSISFADPVERILQDDEQRTLLSAMFRKALAHRGAQLSERHVKALSEASSPGSLTVNAALSRNIYELLPSYGIWSTLAVEQLGTLTTKFLVDTVDPIAYVIDEAGAFTDDSNIAGASVSATVVKIGVILKISRELLQDAERDIPGSVLKKFARAIAYRLDYLAFRADGTADATHGGCTGVFNYGTLATAASGNTTMETLDFEDITAVLLTPGVEALNRASRWWMHPHILVRFLHIKDSNGRPIFLTSTEAPTPGGIGSILGFPVTLGNVLPTTNTAGSKVAAFGDPDSFVVGIRQDVETMWSEHAYFANDQVGVRGVMRAAAKGRLATGIALLKTAAS